MKISIVAILLFLIHYDSISQNSVSAVITIDAKDWSGDAPYVVHGLCHFYKGQLLSPSECNKAVGEVLSFPTLWKIQQNNEPSTEYGTYSLLIVLPHQHQKDLALAIPQVYSSYQMWANGKMVAENGTVGKSKEECKPQWRPQTVPLEIATDTLSLVLQIANFHHAKGGIKDAIFLGPGAKMQFNRTIAVVSNLMETVALLSLGLFFLFVFYRQPTKKVALYFALLCLTWSIRSLFSNLYLSISFFPEFDWSTMLRIEYVTLYLTMIWAILFLSRLFNFETNLFAKYIFVFCNLLFTVFTLFAPPIAFTQWLPIYLAASALLLLYAGFTVIRAWVNERVGSGLLTISIILGINIFAYDIFVYEGFSSYNPIVFGLGYISIFFLMAWALAMQLNLIKSKPNPSSRLTYDDLFKREE